MEISPGIHRIKATFGDNRMVYVHLLVGEEAAMLVDTGCSHNPEADILPYAREHDLVVVTSDVTDFGARSSEAHAGVVLLYDDTMPAYRVASALIAMVDTYLIGTFSRAARNSIRGPDNDYCKSLRHRPHDGVQSYR